MKGFCGTDPEELTLIAEEYSYDRALAIKAVTSFYRKREYDFSRMNSLPVSFRKLLVTVYETGIPKISEKISSGDGSVKYLFETEGNKVFESVFIPDGKRKTLCISSQSGCRMNCPFCVTAKVGFRGNLSAGEMVGQVLAAENSKEITNVVFMGMGEPLDNIAEVLKACSILTADWGLALGRSNITVSTVGLTAPLKRFLDGSGCNLTLSLFSPFDGEREKVLPVQRSNPVSGIIETIKACSNTDRRRRIGIAYMMIEGVNDTEKHLKALSDLFSGSKVTVNLLPYHSNEYTGFRASSDTTISYFRKKLTESGITATIRKSRGRDIGAACGLLAAKKISR